jgi:hypothetical protein
MSVVTGSNGELRWQGTRIAKCRNFSLDINRDALETSVLASFDRTYTEGMRGASGSATILYDEDDTISRNLLNSIFDADSSTKSVSMVLNTSTGKALEFQAFVTQVGTPVAVGEVTACSIGFQVSGPFNGGF